MIDLALRVASTPAVGLDLDRHLGEMCSELVRMLRVSGVVVVVLDPAGAYGSDDAATLIGNAQHGASVGPVASAMRTGQPMLTPDLRRVGPPGLAAAAAECGMVSSGVLPLTALDRPVGAIQLVGLQGWLVEPGHLDLLEPLAGVLAAQLANVAALARPTGPPPRPVPAPRGPSLFAEPDPATSPQLAVPSPRPRPGAPARRYSTES
jgi:GAF domain